MSYDDDPWYDPEDSDDRSAWRPPSRAGRASLALAVVAALSLGVTLPLAAGESRAVGVLALGVTCTLAAVGVVLGAGALLQKGVRRGYALAGALASAALLAVALAAGAASL